MIKGPKNYAISRAQLARSAKPLGEIISGTAKARRESGSGGEVIPPPPVVTSRPGTNRRRATNAKEAGVLRDCLAFLHRVRIFAWRNNTGTLWTNGQPVSFGFPGSPDIVGILPDGRFLGVECKSAYGKQSAKQKKFEQRVHSSKGVYILARCTEDLEGGLQCVGWQRTSDDK